MNTNEIIKQFIEGIYEYSDYTISIVEAKTNEVIASTEQSWIGEMLLPDFHPYEKHPQLQKWTLEEFAGLAVEIEIGKHTIGTLMINGINDATSSVIVPLKMALEIRLKYEKQEVQEKKELSKKQRLLSYIFSDEENSLKVNSLADELGYEKNIPRICVILISKDRQFKDNISLTNLFFDSSQDIVSDYEDKVIVLKHLKNGISDYEEYIEKYIQFLEQNTVFNGDHFCGMPFFSLERCRESYSQGLWLIAHQHHLDSFAHRKYFIAHFIELYLIDGSYEKFNSLLEPYMEILAHSNTDEIVSIIGCLIENSYNLTKTSKILFMHKNTLIYRFNKIKNKLKLDPQNSAYDRDLFHKIFYLFIYNKFFTKKGEYRNE